MQLYGIVAAGKLDRDTLVEVEIEVEIDTKIGGGVWASFPALKSSFLNFTPFLSLS